MEYALPLFMPFRLSDEGKTKVEDKSEEKDDIGKGASLLCRNCRHKITRHDRRIEVSGRHRHVLANPSGVVFDIGCFSAAEGCANYGIPTLEFTWFAGFGWRFSLCGKCGVHLGWLYSKGNSNFYGLILGNLVEEKEK